MQTQRRIRSFVLRAGRMTPAQERALTELWPSYGVDLGADPLDLEATSGAARLAAWRSASGWGK
jgi:tRNA (guanine-N7-)-methyltransferase